MSVEAYLGNPPQNIIDWIKDHLQPIEHPETRFTLEGGTVETYNITGTLDQQWMIDNGFFNENDWEWIKIITQADIGNTVRSIGASAFNSCQWLTNIAISDNVTSIGENAFSGCSGLTSVIIPNRVRSISSSAFYNCISLTNVMIGNGLRSIGSDAFYGCSALTSVTIPDSVTDIREDVFYGCNSLMSVTITSNGGDAENVKQMLIDAGVSSSITWNMPS